MEVVMTVWSHEHTGERGGMMHFPLGARIAQTGLQALTDHFVSPFRLCCCVPLLVENSLTASQAVVSVAVDWIRCVEFAVSSIVVSSDAALLLLLFFCDTVGRQRSPSV